MKVGILGYGKEGQSAEKYFQKHGANVQVFDKFTLSEVQAQDFSDFDLILRSPSVHPRPDWTSSTRYFFGRCPCPIIGVTGTKGKGTTCSLIAALLKTLGQSTYLVGNIGNPAIDVLDELKTDDVVVYEMSSFQLWDLEKSPQISVILRIDPDHLNVHDSFEDYVQAKANICRYQTHKDCCIFYNNDSDSRTAAQYGNAEKIAYPITDDKELDKILDSLNIPGQHNRDNAQAALLAVSSFLRLDLHDFITKYKTQIITTFHNFQGLPHRLQFIRELNGVQYYDDNFSSAYPALDVALAAFPEQTIFLIAGGQDRGMDHSPARERIFSAAGLKKAFLIGETSRHLSKNIDTGRYQLCDSLPEALNSARQAAEIEAKMHPETPVVILMSPGAPSFDMFKNFADRGDQFQTLVKEI